MTDTSTPPVAPAEPTLSPSKTKLPLVALIFAGVGFLFAIFPATAGIAWLLLIPAIILGIIALVKKKQPTWMGLVAVIGAPIAWLIAIIVTVGSFAAGFNSAVNDTVPNPVESSAEETVESAAPEPAEPSGEATLGQTLTNNDGVAVTFTALTCGLAQAGPEFLSETAKGQFCEVKYTVSNGGTDSISLYASDVTGEIGGLEYESDGTISTFGGDYFTTDLNPGLSTEAIVYIDIPGDKALEYLVYVPQWAFFTDDIRVKVN